MFNSISHQLNSYNSGSSRMNYTPNMHYFPIASQFSQFSPKPVTAASSQLSYHYYQPKSKIGQLNQRIEEEQSRREAMRRRSNSRTRDGYLSDSQRSQHSIRSTSRR